MGGVEGEHTLLQTPEIRRRSLESGDCPSRGSQSLTFPCVLPRVDHKLFFSLFVKRRKSIYALSCHVATFQGLLVTFINFPFFFFSVKPSGALKRSLTLFQVFSLRQRMSALGKSLVRLLKVMGCWESRFLRLMCPGVVDCVWCLLSCWCGDGQKAARTPESHPPSPGKHPQCPPLTLFWVGSFQNKR